MVMLVGEVAFVFHASCVFCVQYIFFLLSSTDIHLVGCLYNAV